MIEYTQTSHARVKRSHPNSDGWTWCVYLYDEDNCVYFYEGNKTEYVFCEHYDKIYCKSRKAAERLANIIDL